DTDDALDRLAVDLGARTDHVQDRSVHGEGHGRDVRQPQRLEIEGADRCEAGGVEQLDLDDVAAARRVRMDLAVGVLDRDPVAGVVDGVLREAATVLTRVPDGSDGILRQTVREVEDEDVAGRADEQLLLRVRGPGHLAVADEVVGQHLRARRLRGDTGIVDRDLDQLAGVLAHAVELVVDEPGERPAPDDLQRAALLAGLEIDDADAVQAVVPRHEVLPVRGDGTGTGARVRAGVVGQFDLVRLEQVARVGGDGEVGLAARTAGTPHLGGENRGVRGTLADEPVDDGIPDAGAHDDATARDTGDRVEDVHTDLEPTRSPEDREQVVLARGLDLRDVHGFRDGVADLLVVVTEGDALTGSGVGDGRVGDLARSGGRGVVVARARREGQCESERDGRGDRPLGALHDPAPTFGRAAGRVWQSSPMIGAIVQVYDWDSSDTHQMISWSKLPETGLYMIACMSGSPQNAFEHDGAPQQS